MSASASFKGVAALTTLEDANNAMFNAGTGVITGLGGQATDSVDLRSLTRGETMAGFDNRPFDFDDPLMKQRE